MEISCHGMNDVLKKIKKKKTNVNLYRVTVIVSSSGPTAHMYYNINFILLNVGMPTIQHLGAGKIMLSSAENKKKFYNLEAC